MKGKLVQAAYLRERAKLDAQQEETDAETSEEDEEMKDAPETEEEREEGVKGWMKKKARKLMGKAHNKRHLSPVRMRQPSPQKPKENAQPEQQQNVQHGGSASS